MDNSTSAAVEVQRQDVFKASNTNFWETYIRGRPTYPQELLLRVLDFHDRRGAWDTAHDIATGPGFVASDLAEHFARIVGSDVTPSAVDFCKTTYSATKPNIAFQIASAEDIEKVERPSSVDLVTIGEAIPILDVPAVVHKIANVLKPGGTLAFWFYARPVFFSIAEDEEKDRFRPDRRCNSAYMRLLEASVHTANLREHGSTHLPFLQSSWEHQMSCLDDIELPSSLFSHVERHKWNCDLEDGIALCSSEVFGLKEIYTRRVGMADRVIESKDRDFFVAEWSVEDVQRFLSTCMASMHATNWDAEDLALLAKELENAIGGEGMKKRVVFPMVLVLASRR